MLGSVDFGDTAVVADLEAGIGTFTRLPEHAVDAVLVVVEATPKSMEVGRRARQLAAEKDLGAVTVVANRIRGDEDLSQIQAVFPGDTVVGIPDDPAIRAADRHGHAPLDAAPGAPGVTALIDLATRLTA